MRHGGNPTQLPTFPVSLLGGFISSENCLFSMDNRRNSFLPLLNSWRAGTLFTEPTGSQSSSDDRVHSPFHSFTNVCWLRHCISSRQVVKDLEMFLDYAYLKEEFLREDTDPYETQNYDGVMKQSRLEGGLYSSVANRILRRK